MQVSTDDLATLLQIQQADRAAAQADKKLQALPERATILECRTKKRELLVKKAKLDELHADAEARFAALGDEDDKLAEKQARVQEEIDSSSAGFRDVESRTRELNGLAKRRNTLEGELNEASEELSKIEGLQAQLGTVLADIESRESAATEVFVREGGALKQQAAQLRAQRTELAAQLSAALLKTYEKTAQRCGGVAIGRLSGNACGVCRASIEHGRLIDLKAGGNVIVCPHCGRMLIVVNSQAE